MGKEPVMNDLIRLVVGFDARETIAYHVFCQSVLENTSLPVSFLPLVEKSLALYKETHQDGDTSFPCTGRRQRFSNSSGSFDL